MAFKSFESDINFADTSPENQAHIRRILEVNKFKKNVMPLEEFTSKYMVLFRKDMIESRPPDLISEAIQDYFARIDQFHPVYVVRSTVASSVQELLSDDNLVYTLPPVFATFNPVNAAGDGGVNALQAFTNLATMNLEDTFGHKQKAFGERVGAIINAINPDDRLDEARRKAAEMADRVPGVRESRNTIDGTAEVIKELDSIPSMGHANSSVEIVSKEVPL